MDTLLVLYDDECPFCVWCRDELEAAEKITALEFLSCRAPSAAERFGRIPGFGYELIVAARDGRAWVGPDAFIVCLFALESWREASEWLASPLLLPLTRRFFARVSDERATLGRLLGLRACDAGHCGVPTMSSPYR